MSELKPVTRKEAYWAAVADDSITPPEPQTTEECILAAMSGNYPTQDIKPQTREQGLMKQAVDATQKAMVQNVEWVDNPEATSFNLSASSSTIHSFVKSVIIPDGVTEIEESCFNGCNKLESVMIPDSVATIGNNAFAFCAALKSVIIPDGVTLINSGTFQYCVALESVVIPDSVLNIGSSAFIVCRALKSITIPDSVAEISANAFDSCTNLANIYVPWSEDDERNANAPWGATNATIHYNYTGE